MELGLHNKTVLISGSSQGIGLAIAIAFLKEGANVVITSRDADKVEAVAGKLTAQFGDNRVVSFIGDMTKDDDIDNAINKVIKIFGSIDTVIANIGNGSSKQGWELERSDWQNMMDLNFLGAMSLCKYVIPHMQKSEDASITFISSIAGCEAISAPIPYSAAKAALQHAAKNLSRQLAPQGIRVNTVAPGNVLAPGGTWERKLAEDPVGVESYISKEVPLGRIGKAEEIADSVVFLASQRASFVTGSLLVVDGGQSHV